MLTLRLVVTLASAALLGLVVLRPNLYAESKISTRPEIQKMDSPCGGERNAQATKMLKPQVMQLLAQHLQATSDQATWLAIHDMPMVMSLDSCSGKTTVAQRH